MIDIKINKSNDLWGKMFKTAKEDNKLSVGFFEDSMYGPENDNLPVAQVAQWNEEGSDTNPPRPFMRVGFGIPLEKGKFDKQFRESISRIVEGKSSFIQEYNFLGKIFVKDLKDVIEKWDTPPNSPKTIEEKGFNDPLIWTGTMKESVDYKIDKD